MARARKVHVQLSLIPKLDKNGQRRGGKRNGAGRPKKGERASERHKTREAFRPNQPVHIVIRPISDVGTLRGFDTYKAIRNAMITTYARARIRIVHISIQGSHIHMLVEAAGRLQLARGMQGFEIACAKNINAVLSKRLGYQRRGTVFPDRYHAVIIRSPRQARGALAYVLNNWRRHKEDKVKRHWRIDLLSSAPSFHGFKDVDVTSLRFGENYLKLPVWEPKTWLLSTGWKKHGLIGASEIPGKPWKPGDARDGQRAMRMRLREMDARHG
jgi:putative transposase